MSVGLVIKDGAGKEQFNSSRNHLLVDLNADPKHIDTVKILGTNITAAPGATTTEKLFSLEHKLGYTPYITAYFYQVSEVSGSTLGLGGRYYRNFYGYQDIGGVGVDQVNIYANDSNFYVIHTLSHPGGATSDAATKPLFMKYYIFARPAYNNPTL